jgi:hypothetical protein
MSKRKRTPEGFRRKAYQALERLAKAEGMSRATLDKFKKLSLVIESCCRDGSWTGLWRVAQLIIKEFDYVTARRVEEILVILSACLKVEIGCRARAEAWKLGVETRKALARRR